MAYGDSAAASLAAVQTAIAKVLNGQEYYIGQRRLRYADLKELRAMERELSAQVARESGAVPIFTVVQPELPT